jgi:hypothetical protein
MPDEYNARIMSTDETKVKAYPNGELGFYRVVNYKENGQQYKVPRVQNGGVGIMFWGCMTRQAYGPLVVINGTSDGAKYLELLKEYVGILKQLPKPGHIRLQMVLNIMCPICQTFRLFSDKATYE